MTFFDDLVANRQGIEADRRNGIYRGPSSTLDQVAQRYGAHARTFRYPISLLVELSPIERAVLSNERIEKVFRGLEEGLGYQVEPIRNNPNISNILIVEPIHRERTEDCALIDLRKGVVRFYLDTRDPRFLVPLSELLGLRAGENPYTTLADEQLLDAIVSRYPKGITKGNLLREDTALYQVLLEHGLLDAFTNPHPTTALPQAVARKEKTPQIIAELERRIGNGDYTDRLPTINALAGEFSVSTGTIQNVRYALEQRGMIVAHGSRGTFVNPEYRRNTPSQT